MKANEASPIHLGNNIKHLMRAFQITQAQLADKLGMPDSHVCNLLQKADIDDPMLQKIAGAIGYGVTVDLIKNYNHDDTIKYITNNYTQTVENGGTGTLIPNQDNSSTFQEGSSQQINNYVAEQAFEAMKEIAVLKTEIMRLRMKYEPDSVEKEKNNL
ncbi:MAG: helix-turn-helix domain-containing protein [Tannerella sp.]|jgi:transcriptional regulator with XRE-family HTH domain|nr:helix-turn-helix domain-containing protein [Tannerella sp.]